MTETWAVWAAPPTGKATTRKCGHHMPVHLYKHASVAATARCSRSGCTLLPFRLHAAPVPAARCSRSGYTLLPFRLHRHLFERILLAEFNLLIINYLKTNYHESEF